MAELKFRPEAFRYSSRRECVYGKNGMVATSHPAAAQVGLELLKKGGNAIDAAIGTAAALTVVEPGSNGIGGDSFSIIWKDNKMYGLNASGPSPQKLKPDKYNKGEEDFPTFGIQTVTVPGVPAAWVELSRKHGKLSLEEVLEPAAKLAEEGFVVTNVVAQSFERAFKRYSKDIKKHPELQSWFDVFAPEGKPVKAMDVLKLEGHAKGLRAIAQTEGKAFYSGEIARAIDAFSVKHKGELRYEDLNMFKPEWVDPISINYKGYDIWEMPPNGQGIVALMALNSLKFLQLDGIDNPFTLHKQIEAIKLAFSDGNLSIADSRHMTVSKERLLSETYAESRSRLIKDSATEAVPGIKDDSGTVYLATADSEGNMVSYIQSNYMGFGAGAVVPEFGISLNNRALGFTREEGHVNCLGPGKRPFNTIIPGFITKNQKAVGPFGVMGGQMQPQGHVQVVQSLIDFNLNPQDALDAPRWQWLNGNKVIVEPELPVSTMQALKSMGHEIAVELNKGQFGRGQIIIKNEKDVLIGGTEPRTDGSVAAW